MYDSTVRGASLHCSGLLLPLGDAVDYRNIVRPSFAKPPATPQAGEWMTWLQSERALRAAAPRPDQCCSLCFGPVGLRDDGAPFARCLHCRGYASAVTAFLPMTYSLDEGLESMLHRYKDKAGYDWLRHPLGAMFWLFVSRHRQCITQSYGEPTLWVAAPSDESRRSFHPMLRAINSWSNVPDLPWAPADLVARNPEVDRPPRGQLRPDAYLVSNEVDLRRQRLVLVDDTWTSGSTAASVAAAVKQRGAASVVVLTLGRQLNSESNFCNSRDLVATARTRGWSHVCLLE